MIETNRVTGPLLIEARWHDPVTARMDDATYMGYLLAAGWCLNPRCSEPPFHCHVRQGIITKELRRLMR